MVYAKGKRFIHRVVITFFTFAIRAQGCGVMTQGSFGIAPRVSSSSRKLGWALDGTEPRPISTEI